MSYNSVTATTHITVYGTLIYKEINDLELKRGHMTQERTGYRSSAGSSLRAKKRVVTRYDNQDGRNAWMFAWPGRASDAETIDAAVVGGTRSLAPSNSDRGEGSSEHRTAQERRIENREEVKRPLCCLRPPSSPHPPASSRCRCRQTRRPTIQTATSGRSVAI